MSRFGCIKDQIDVRDYLMKGFLPEVKLPSKVDWTDKMSPVRDQGDEGTCVGFASVAGMKEYQEKKDYKELVLLSPRFLYNECKKIDGMPSEEGTTIRAAMQVLQKIGVCQEIFWPYLPYQINEPREGAKTDAKTFCIKTYARIIHLDELRQSLFLKGPCIIGVEVFKGMLNTKTGIIPMKGIWDKSLGGHAICPVGYDDKKELIKFKNSWSEKWGQNGYGFLPYKYIKKYMIDAWSSVDIDDPKPL